MSSFVRVTGTDIKYDDDDDGNTTSTQYNAVIDVIYYYNCVANSSARGGGKQVAAVIDPALSDVQYRFHTECSFSHVAAAPPAR